MNRKPPPSRRFIRVIRWATVSALLYGVIDISLLFFLGGAGHGPGIEWAWMVSQPAVWLLSDNAPLGAWLVLGALQYGFLGGLIGFVTVTLRQRRE